MDAAAWVRWLRQFGLEGGSPSRLECAYWYDAASHEPGGPADADLAELRSVGRIPKLKLRLGGITGLGVDVELAVDLVLLAARDAIDTAVLVSGEADLVPAVERARAEGVRVILAYPIDLADSISIDLLASASDRVEIDRSTSRELLIAAQQESPVTGEAEPPLS